MISGMVSATDSGCAAVCCCDLEALEERGEEGGVSAEGRAASLSFEEKSWRLDFFHLRVGPILLDVYESRSVCVEAREGGEAEQRE